MPGDLRRLEPLFSVIFTFFRSLFRHNLRAILGDFDDFGGGVLDLGRCRIMRHRRRLNLRLLNEREAGQRLEVKETKQGQRTDITSEIFRSDNKQSARADSNGISAQTGETWRESARGEDII